MSLSALSSLGGCMYSPSTSSTCVPQRNQLEARQTAHQAMRRWHWRLKSGLPGPHAIGVWLRLDEG